MRERERSNRFSKLGWKWLVLGVMCLGVVALRHTIAGFAVDVLLRKAFQNQENVSFAYGGIHWEGRTIAIDELDIETPDYRLAVQRIEIVLDTSFSPFSISPHLWIIRPYLIFHESSDTISCTESALSAPLALLDWLRLDIVEGRCEWTLRENAVPEELYFQFVSGNTPSPLGVLECFSCQEMRTIPLIRAEVTQLVEEKKGIVIQWESHDLSTQHLLPFLWTAAGHAITGWERVEGQWQLKGFIAVSGKGKVLDLQTLLAVTDLELRNVELGLHVAAANISLELQQILPDPLSPPSQKAPWYRRIEARAVIEEGEIECTGPLVNHPWGISHIDGRMTWCENEDPLFSLKGVTIQQDEEKEFLVQGTGSLGNENSFWLQTYLKWGDEEKPSLGAAISLCSPAPSSLVVEAQVNELQVTSAVSLASLFGVGEDFFKEFYLNDGFLQGVVTAWIEDEHIERVELRDITFEQLNWNWKGKGEASGFNGNFEGSWRYHKEGWLNNHLLFSFHLDQFQPALVGSALHLANLGGECVIEGDTIARAYCKGYLGEIPLFISWEGMTHAYRMYLSADTTLKNCLKTFAYSSPILDSDAMDEIELLLRLESAPILAEGMRSFGTLLIQNGDESAREILLNCLWKEGGGLCPKGELRAGNLPFSLGALFLKHLAADTQYKGEFGIAGSFDDKGMQLHVDIPCVHISNSLFDAEAKEEQGTFSTLWSSHDFQFLLPLHNVKCTLPLWDLRFSQMGARLEMNRRQMALKDLSLCCEGIAIEGQVHIDDRGVSIRTDKLEGAVEDLERVLEKVSQGSYQALGIRGQFHSGPEGLFFAAPLDLRGPSMLVVQGNFSLATLPLAGGGVLKEMSGSLAFDSRQSRLHFERIQGLFSNLKGDTYSFSLQPSTWMRNDDGKWGGAFDGALYNKEQLEICRLVSQIELLPSSLHFMIDPEETHLLGCPIEQGKGIYHFKTRQLHFEDIKWGQNYGQCTLEARDGKIALSSFRGSIQGIECSLQGTFARHRDAWQGELEIQAFAKTLKLTHLTGRYREGVLLANAKTMIGQTPAILSLQIDTEKETLGVLKLQESEDSQGLGFFFRILPGGTFEPSHMRGEFSGIQTEARYVVGGEALHIQGMVALDFTKIRKLFPSQTKAPWEKLQLGKGYRVEGDVVCQDKRMDFQGKIRGELCELLGRRLESLCADVRANLQRWEFDKIQVSDPAISLVVRKLLLEKKAEDKSWELSCPMLQVRDFNPGLLQRIDNTAVAQKPFTIRHLTISELMGDLMVPESFSGKCLLHFTNAKKREESLLGLSLDFLKDLGLEPSLLVPLQGELEGQLESGRLYFTSLKGSYSEGRRTQFFLAEKGEGSYIDFAGNIHIDLSIKQAVVLKLAESLTLGIRGSLEKPHYILMP